MTPKIAILPLQNCEKNTLWIDPLYFAGIEQAGGLPVLLPLSRDPEKWEAYCQSFDGFVFTGGQDVAPALFGQEKLPECGYQAPMRDNQELFMMSRLRELDKPVLGICRGLQVMNVAFGGTLWQDLASQCPSPVIHRQGKPYQIPHHQVNIREGTMLRDIVGHKYLSVNSMHHQAVRDVARDFTVSAVAPDGIVEAMELPTASFFLGIQWHPEHLFDRSPAACRIWQALVDAAAPL